MPRPPRFTAADLPQHVIQRGNNRQRTFFDARDRHRYLSWLATAARECACEVHAYVLMSNHVHLLATPRSPLAIASMMQSVGRRYVRYLNDKRGRTGTLWEGRYKAFLVPDREYLFACARYIELNPVRAGLVTDPVEYIWSSFSCNALGRPDPLIAEHGEFTALGRTPEERRAAYREMFEASPLGADTIAMLRRDIQAERTTAPGASGINGLERRL